MAKKPMRVKVTETGCYVVTTHKTNHDGYFRKYVNDKHQMFHRFIWEMVNGPIPAGCEVDHQCKNRACFNLHHLRLLDGSTHASISNTERYTERFQKAYAHWKETRCTGTALAEKFDVTISTGCRWIRGWSQP